MLAVIASLFVVIGLLMLVGVLPGGVIIGCAELVIGILLALYYSDVFPRRRL